MLLLLQSCNILRSIPESTPVTAKENQQILVTEHFRKPDITEAQPTQILTDQSFLRAQDAVTTHSYAHSHLAQDRPSLINDDTLYVEPKDTVYTEDMIAEAEQSDKVAQKAVAFSIVALLGIIMFPLFIIGVALTIYFLIKYRKFTYVTEDGLRKIKRAKILLAISILLPLFAILLLVFLLIYFL